MTQAKYMALADVQEIWTGKQKPFINQTFATKSEVLNYTVTPITTNTTSACTITGSSNDKKSQTIIYTNSSGADLTVTVPTTYKTPDGQAISIICPNGGYCEVNYLNVSGVIYARGV